MTIEWRGVAAGGVDHERLWTAVIAASVVTAATAVWVMGVPPIGCVFKALTGLPCLTCGFTRGVLALALADVAGSFRWNPLVPLGAAAGSAYFLYATAAVAAGPRRLRIQFSRIEGRLARWGTVTIALMVWGWLIVDGR